MRNRFFKYPWLVIALLWAICVLNYADRQAVFSVFGVLEREYGFNKQELGLIGSAFMIVYALFSPIAGVIVDRYHRNKIIIGGLAVWSVFTALTGFCTSLWSFVFVRGAEGLGETFYFPASTSLISDYHAAKTRSRALGLHHTGTYVGTILGGILAGWIAEKYGWQMPFQVFGIAGCVLAVLLIAILREPPRNDAELQAGASPQVAKSFWVFGKELSSNGSALTLVAVFILANFVTLPFYAWLPTFMAEKFNVGLAEAAFSATFYLQASSAIGALVGGYLADHWKQSSPGGRVFTQGFGVLLYAPFLFFLSSTPNYIFCLVALGILGLFKGMYDANVWSAFYDVVPYDRRGTICGFANTLAWLGGSISVYLVGYVANAKWLTMSQTLRLFPLLNIFMAIGLFAVGLKMKTYKTPSNFSRGTKTLSGD